MNDLTKELLIGDDDPYRVSMYVNITVKDVSEDEWKISVQSQGLTKAGMLLALIEAGEMIAEDDDEL